MLANNEELPLNFTQSEPIKERPPLFEEKTVTSQLTEKRLAVTESKTSENSSKGAKRTKLPI